MHLRFVFAGAAEHLDNLTHRRAFARGGMNDLNDHFFAILCAMQVTRRNGDVLTALLVVGQHLGAVT